MYDANQVLNGTLSWDVIPLMPMASLAGRTELLQVALLLFPELMVFPSRFVFIIVLSLELYTVCPTKCESIIENVRLVLIQSFGDR